MIGRIARVLVFLAFVAFVGGGGPLAASAVSPFSPPTRTEVAPGIYLFRTEPYSDVGLDGRLQRGDGSGLTSGEPVAGSLDGVGQASSVDPNKLRHRCYI